MIAQRSPRAWRRRGHDEKNSATGILADRYPVCNLHGVRLVYGFPRGCPLSFANPVDRIRQITRRGWAQLGDRGTDDHRGGLALLHVADVCNRCTDWLLRDQHTRYLRGKVRHDE